MNEIYEPVLFSESETCNTVSVVWFPDELIASVCSLYVFANERDNNFLYI